MYLYIQLNRLVVSDVRDQDCFISETSLTSYRSDTPPEPKSPRAPKRSEFENEKLSAFFLGEKRGILPRRLDDET